MCYICLLSLKYTNGEISMDRDTLRQLKESRIAKTKAVAGNTSRFEFSYDKAARIAGVPYYQQPADMRPEDRSKPQRLGDDFNLQGNRSGFYENDVSPSDWTRGPHEEAERKPNFTGSEHQARKPGYAKHPGTINPNPATIGKGARQSFSRRGHQIDSDD
jgi:hypothetical protein